MSPSSGPSAGAAPPEARRAQTRGGLAGWQQRTLTRLAETELATLTVAGMAAAAHLSPHHFSRAFRHSFGMPPREWLIRTRLERAQAQLRETSEPVDRIATALGYRSGSQLARIFRARLGRSPKAFRRG